MTCFWISGFLLVALSVEAVHRTTNPPLQKALPPNKGEGASTCKPTTPDVEGPYFKPNAPKSDRKLCQKTSVDFSEAHDRLLLHGRVVDAGDCQTPLPSKLEIWQANMKGEYSPSKGNNRDFNCRATMETDKEGRFYIETMFPGRYLDAGGYRPAHIHFKIAPVSNKYDPLTTQLYFQHDSYLYPNDSCGDYCRSMEPSLIVPVTNLDDLKTFQGEWTIYLKAGEKTDVFDPVQNKMYKSLKG